MRDILFYVLTLFICAALGVFAARSHAADLDSSVVLEAYREAHFLSRLPYADELPEIYLVTAQELRDIRCDGRQCAVLALQLSDALYLDEALNWDEPFNRTVLVHELVHYLQFKKWGPARTCEENIAREHVAYAVQNMALERSGVAKRVGLQVGSCV